MANARAVKLISKLILDPRTDMKHFGRLVMTHAYEVREWLAEKPLVDLDKCKTPADKREAQLKLDMLVQLEHSTNYKYLHFWQYANGNPVSPLEFDIVVQEFYIVAQHLMEPTTLHAMLQHIRSQALLDAIHARADLVPDDVCHPSVHEAIVRFAAEPANIWRQDQPYSNRARALNHIDELPWFKQEEKAKRAAPSIGSGGIRRGQMAMLAAASLGAGHLNLK